MVDGECVEVSHGCYMSTVKIGQRPSNFRKAMNFDLGLSFERNNHRWKSLDEHEAMKLYIGD